MAVDVQGIETGSHRVKRGDLVFARRTMGYGGKDLDRGQVFKLEGLVNDEALVRLGHAQVIRNPKRFKGSACRFCEAEFFDLNMLNGHGDKKHKPISEPMAPEPRRADETALEYQNRIEAHGEALMRQEESRLDSDEKREARAAPLYLENSEATRGA